MKMLLVSFFFAFSSASPVLAFTGSNLLSACESKGGDWGDGACLGFVLGFVQGLEYAGIATTAHFAGWKGFETTNSEAERILTICRPEGVSTEQVRLVTLKFLNDHPERLHESAYFLVADALKGAFPCN
jgi:hypothetical protein